MKLIIDIPELFYNNSKKRVSSGIDLPIDKYVANGTPIEDGDLISRHELLLSIEQQIAYLRSVGHDTYLMGLIYSKQYVSGAPAIGEEEDDGN